MICYSNNKIHTEMSKLLAAGGKPSTWLPPGGLVEHIYHFNFSETVFFHEIVTVMNLEIALWGANGA